MEAGVKKRIIGVDRFDSEEQKKKLEDENFEIIKGNLLDQDFIQSLPEVKNVIFLVRMKFGSEENLSLTWAVNFSFPEKFDNFPEKAENDDIVKISDFDKRVFGADRTILLEALISEYPDRDWILRKMNRITGYALGRAGTRYNHIGPVSACSVRDSVILIKKALENNTERPVVVDIPENKNELSEWLQTAGFTASVILQECTLKKILSWEK